MSLEDVAHLLPRQESPEEWMATGEVCRRLWSRVDNLPTRYREAVILRYGFNGEDGLDFRAIGTRLGVSGARAYQMVMKAIRTMRRPSVVREVSAALYGDECWSAEELTERLVGHARERLRREKFGAAMDRRAELLRTATFLPHHTNPDGIPCWCNADDWVPGVHSQECLPLRESWKQVQAVVESGCL